MISASILSLVRIAFAIFLVAVCRTSIGSQGIFPSETASQASGAPFAQKAQTKAVPRKAPGKAAGQASAKTTGKPNTKARAKVRAPEIGPSYANRADAMALADDVALRRDLDAAWVRRTIGLAHRVPLVEKLMTPPAVGVAKNWAAYRARFIEPLRINAGVKFWLSNREALARAEQQFGVPAAIIVGILGVETIYGQQMGNFRVLDALCTLAFDFPAAHPRAGERSAYFKGELEQYLSRLNRTGAAPLAELGSFAGAVGMAQFMPTSWHRFALDFDGDGKIDLHMNAADAIGSVANYFRAYGWKPGAPTHFELTFDTPRLQLDSLLVPDILPTFSAARMAELGVFLSDDAQRHDGKLALVELQNGPQPARYVAGTDNFYVITRYNWSSYYAMAVIELGAAVAQQLPP